ncbi:uncharacterized protein LOC121656940 [Melanotaenia boesemani]|uniref:uncharacterized protein LOC121656940 n=1 Tax=Melanotaenia boesemani TaxID=1250792 RepID=UPI001C04E105|nr:uncharacterized protein LOC121656940 [Melanotaenia boesemani]
MLSVIHCQKSVQLVDDDFLTCFSADSPLPPVPPALSQVPSDLWATSPHDVGLVKNCPPVVITPKSDYRPCQKQYPLKPEALEVMKPREPPTKPDWRFVQDLFVVDLANAFTSVPVHPDSQFWFAFEFNGKPYTWTRLPQGYCESPTIYNEVLRDSLSSLQLPQGVVLLSYVDDLLLCCPSASACEEATLALLLHLHSEGHKASLHKLQFCQSRVLFLGHHISATTKALAPKRIEAIQKAPKPVTKKQLMSFLGMVGFCRAFIPHFSELEAPLAACIHGKNLSAHDHFLWTPDAEQAFLSVKQVLCSAPALALPDPFKPFFQFVDEKHGFMSSVLLQQHGSHKRPVAYYSSKLDSVAAGLPGCLRAVAACEKAVLASRDIVGYSELTVFVPHSVSIILLEQKTSHLSAARWLRYTTVLLDMPNITVKRCTTLNPATLLPTADDGVPHCCETVLSEACTPRPDLSDEPLLNSDLVLFCDGSSSRDPSGKNRVGFAVCNEHQVLLSGSLPSHFSAQTAELVALTEACKLAQGKSLTVYTDSRYAFGVVHDFGALWRHRKFLKSDGKPILNSTQIAALLDAILLPSEVAVVKCQAHTKDTSSVAHGNALADQAAKQAALSASPHILASSPVSEEDQSPPCSLQDIQSFSTPEERLIWKENSCTPDSAGYNTARPLACPPAGHTPPNQPFDHLMMDFIELTPAEGKKYCLVMVDMWSKWVEAFPAKHATSSVVAKALVTEIIPRWGIPAKVSSDNGSHFVNAALKEVSGLLGFQLKTHCSYHPQSGGAIERENATLKGKLAKCCEETGLSWPKALPLVLMHMRMRKRARMNLSPFEILFGRPPHTSLDPPGLSVSTTHCEGNMLAYCQNLSKVLSQVQSVVKEALPRPASGLLHSLVPGDWVLVRETRRKHWRSKRWLGPFQVLLVTHTAVKVAERSTWIHASHCRRFQGTPTPAPTDLSTTGQNNP